MWGLTKDEEIKVDQIAKRFWERERKNRTLLDPLTKKDTLVTELEEMYGPKLVKAIERCIGKDGQCYARKELIDELRAKRKNFPAHTEKSKQEKSVFLCAIETIRNGKLLNAVTLSELSVLLFLGSTIIREPLENDKHNLFSYYTDRKLLVSSCSYTTLCNKTGLSRSTVDKSIKGLNKKGYIEIEKSSLYGQNIYILGWYNNKGGNRREYGFVDRELKRQKPVDYETS